MDFYDKSGRAVAYVAEDGETIYHWNGTPVAYLVGESVYAIRGRHLGWFDTGWIRDRGGAPVVFTPEAGGSGPMKPMLKMKPMRSMRKMQPMRGMRQMQPMRPIPKMSWPATSAAEFFTTSP
jgi:hypothetical protein